MQASPVPSNGSLPFSRSLDVIKAEQAVNLDILRVKMVGIEMKDVVPFLVSRRVLNTMEMSDIYSKNTSTQQLDALLSILSTKNHWMGCFIDSLIRNGQSSIVKELLNETNINRRSPSSSPK
uniref:CARD domain-containing protein n=1 Tax=Rhabditophanes sp. KR3021 TaxID=114890 RepID=A0AC35TSN9_9BILA